MVLADLLARLSRVLPLLLLGGLGGCDSGKAPGTATQVLEVPKPEHQATAYIADQTEIARQILTLWYEDGGCKLEVKVNDVVQGEMRWLKPTGPCYFVRSPGSQDVQVYQASKTRQVVAVLGTPVQVKNPDNRCGRELQGLIIEGGDSVKLSSNTRSGSVYCAHQGLDNFQYGLFTE